MRNIKNQWGVGRAYADYDELYHHGILGQKWGVRRFQNPDGSLTNAGKLRYKDYKNGTSQLKKFVRVKGEDRRPIMAIHCRSENKDKVTKIASDFVKNYNATKHKNKVIKEIFDDNDFMREYGDRDGFVKGVHLQNINFNEEKNGSVSYELYYSINDFVDGFTVTGDAHRMNVKDETYSSSYAQLHDQIARNIMYEQ